MQFFTLFVLISSMYKLMYAIHSDHICGFERIEDGSGGPSVDLAPASTTLQLLFDQLLAYDGRQARDVLDQTIDAVKDLDNYRHQLDHVMTSPMQLRTAHINNCRNAREVFRNGLNGADILQTLMIDHLVLVTSTDEELTFLIEPMFSVYLNDVATPTNIPNIPWYRREMIALLLEHAGKKEYYHWQNYLPDYN